MNRLKTLVLDIETLPLQVYVWELKDQDHISLAQIKQDWSLASWAAKWLGDPASKMMYRDNRNKKNPYDDKEMLEDLWKLLDEAHIVLTQNGEKFDALKINARFQLHGIRPPTPYRHIDTYKIEKRAAKHTSNKLEYLTDRLNTRYKKLSHGDFPGWELWKQCIEGNKEAWDAMKKYNIHDVLATEELYENIKAWMPESMAKPFDVTDVEKECGTCGYVGKLRVGEPRKAKNFWYTQHSCVKCGTFQTGMKIKKEAA